MENIRTLTDLKKLILGHQALDLPTGLYKRTMLTGYLCILVVMVALFHLAYDLLYGSLNDFYLYAGLLASTVVAFWLNRFFYFNTAKAILLSSTLSALFLFRFSEPYDTGIYFYFFPLTVAAFALFDFQNWKKGLVFAVLVLLVYSLSRSLEWALFDRPESPSTVEINLFVHFIISVATTALILVFLLKLNHAVESELRDSERNALEMSHELVISKQRFELAIGGSSVGIYDWDIQQNRIHHSPTWKSMLGYECHEVDEFSIGDFYTMVHPDDRQRIEAKLNEHLQLGSRYAEEVRLRKKNGGFEWFIDAGQAHWDVNGNPVRMVGTLVDISVQKEAEEKIKEQNRILEKTNAELDNFVYSTSHDLRSPLLSLLGLINISEGTSDEKEIKYCLGLMKSRVHRLDDFITEIIDYSKNTRLQLTSERLYLKPMVEALIEELALHEKFDHIQFTWLVQDDFHFFTDLPRFKIVIRNLLMNAIKYHNSYRPNPFISIDASADVDSVTIEIADNGEGIKAEYQQKIFNMFFRGTEKSKGSGLGLYIARETVEKLKGTITVESTYSEGSKFIVTLPQPAIGSLKQTNAKEVLTENAPDRSIG